MRPSKRKQSKSPAESSETNRRPKRNASHKKEELQEEELIVEEEELQEEELMVEEMEIISNKPASRAYPKKKEVKDEKVEIKQDGEDEDEGTVRFLGEPVPKEEAKQQWPHRYLNQSDLTGEELTQARCHYAQAEVDGQVYLLEDDAFVKAPEDTESFICKIKEIFQAVDGSKHFRAQWYYRSYDTVIKDCDNNLNEEQKLNIDKQCVFFSEVKDDNPLECLVKKIKIARLPLKVKADQKAKVKSSCDFYCDKMYLLPFTSFVSLETDSATESNESGSTISSDSEAVITESLPAETNCNEKTLLDLYSGCGAMSTGLCLGANSNGVKLVTKWAVDINQYACDSLRLNHPETQVRNEAAENFLALIKEWEKLCQSVLSSEVDGSARDPMEDCEEEDAEGDADDGDAEVYEVEEILDICYGDPNHKKKSELHFKIRWKNYGPEYDTWEPIEGLSDCQEKLKEYVRRGYESKMLPLPGMVDVICGGPPCQGISGFNRFRDKEQPLKDEKNKQLLVYMDIVAYLRPKFVLMENVVDIVRFAHGLLGRYALGRLVSMGYQARMGLMAAGAYGLPQFRMRMFMWGALPGERLPQYPLPTHNVVTRGNVPLQFEENAVTFEGRPEVQLKEKLFLGDAISDLPQVGNDESREEMPYSSGAVTDFQRFIRLRKDEMPGSLCFNSGVFEHQLYDHNPLCLNPDDYERSCRIPKKKGANFRDFPGVRVREDNKVEWDPKVERQFLSSGKPLVPDYAMTFVRGTSSKPFGRLWWDETVPTVVTRAEPHNQVILHPEQDRVLTIRENARLQGFPDYYKLLGPTKERYIQVGNAVAVPVARALGFSLAKASRGFDEKDPLMTLPEDYPMMTNAPSPTVDV